MTKWKKRAIIGAGILVVVILIAVSAFKGLDVATAEAAKGTVTATVVEKGTLVSKDAVDIFSEVQGTVREIHVDVGDSVEKSALLAVIDVKDLDAQIAQLEGELKSVKGLQESALSQTGQNQVIQQQLALEETKINYDLARDDYERHLELYNEGAVTKTQLDSSRAAMENAQKAVEQAETALNAAKRQSQGSSLQYQGQIESITARLEHLRGQKEKARITSDRDGLVFAKKVKEGDYVTSGAILFTVGTTDLLEIETYVSSKDIVNVKNGDEVRVVLKMPGEDIELTGEIARVAPAAEEKMSSLGILEDKVKVIIRMPKRPEGINLTPGTTVDVTVTTQEKRGVLAVPKEAVFSDKGEKFVWVVRKGSAVTARVKTGIEGDDLIEIKNGLAQGDEVLLNPHDKELKEGIRVK
ncbi:MAG: hypothetical protein CVU89_15460 [Firmicutes bacterium HGW-Firmicutes-14]|nr:MAG: hypothetical protein CVU89_15460 [Firmicutes bacterium HGW-Firmicutes-14]